MKLTTREKNLVTRAVRAAMQRAEQDADIHDRAVRNAVNRSYDAKTIRRYRNDAAQLRDDMNVLYGVLVKIGANPNEDEAVPVSSDTGTPG